MPEPIINKTLTRDDVLVAVAAHADDAELNAGGLMAKWVTSGGTVRIVMLTNNCSGPMLPDDGDESGQFRLTPEKTSAVRNGEQDAAAKLLGATVDYMDYTQRHFWDGEKIVRLSFEHHDDTPASLRDRKPLLLSYYDPDEIARLTTLLTKHKPCIVLTQPPFDLDPEHHAAACFVHQAMVALRETQPNTELFFWPAGSSLPDGLLRVDYDRVEDISDHFEKKMALCMAHKSQMTRDRLDRVTQRAERFGKAIGVRYAEPFVTARLDGSASKHVWSKGSAT